MSRANHIFLLFRSKVIAPGKDKALPILGGVQCSFKREIKPYQGYEVWTRVLSWDEKWIYFVSHFVVKGKVKPSQYLLQGGGRRGKADEEASAGRKEQKYLFASSVARYVFKSGRKTIPPWKPLVDCNLLPPQWGDVEKQQEGCDDVLLERIEQQRKKNLEIAQLKGGWDAIHEVFSSDDNRDGEILALGRYTDLLWR